MKPSFYTSEELLSRPIEHTLELMTCDELGSIIGASRASASRIIRGDDPLEARQERRLRDWLASCARDAMVTHPRGVEVCGVR